jgi:DNA-binding response OmpR family regulator
LAPGTAVQTGNDGTTRGLAASSRRVLVVEDDPGLCDAVVRVARGFGAEVWQAQSLDEGLRLLERAPDLVIADLRLAGRSAFPLIEAAVQREPPPAVVAMSGQASAEESFRLGRLGVRAYLAKPFASDALLAAVDRAEREPRDAAARPAPPCREALDAGPRDPDANAGAPARLRGVARRAAERLRAFWRSRSKARDLSDGGER